MRNDPFHLFSNEKASLGILLADGDFVEIISENISKVNFFMGKIFCKVFVTLPCTNLKHIHKEAYIRPIMGVNRFISCVIVDKKL